MRYYLSIANTAAIELADCPTWQAEMAQMGVKTRIVAEHGPGGGWPLIEYVGEKSTLLAVLKENFDVDESAADELYGLR